MTGSKNSRKIDSLSLDELPFLSGLQKEFDSVAEMIVARANEIPDRCCVKYYDRNISYAHLNENANRVAHFLKQKGVEKGDIVSLMILNSPEVYDCMFGIQKIGAVAGLINFALKGPEIAYVLDDSKPSIVFVSSEFMTDFSKGYEIAEHKPIVVEVETTVEHSAKLAETTLAEIHNTYPTDEALVAQQADDPFLLLYSSGTTGRPKGILLSNKGQLSICRDMTCLGLVQGGDVMLILLPMFHSNPICVWTFSMIFAGQTLCIRSAFSPGDFWSSIIENQITILMGVPAMYNYVYYSVDPSTLDMSALKLKWAFCGAAPLSVDLIHGFKDKFNVDIIEGYGLTEVTGVSTANPPLGSRQVGSIGLPLPGQEIEIMDDSLNGLPAGERGEICIRGEANMITYLNKPEATAETIQDGWLRTGDIGYVDDDGFIYIVDRKKDMINRGGENIYPREIEIVLEAHPDITAVAVVGIPDEALGERVKVVIEPTPSHSQDHPRRPPEKKTQTVYQIPCHQFLIGQPRIQTVHHRLHRFGYRPVHPC
ncbi:MAG: AMP-binding protein [Deltaproteobacteria bacterium]|nr:AMP-binding protein [Deltaproteobacteria bacterium]